MRGLLTAAAVLPAAACLWGAAAGPVAALAPLVWVGAFWLPGAWLAVPGGAARGTRGYLLWAPLAFGPVLFGAGVCAGRLAGLSPAAAAAGTVCAGACALLVRAAGLPSFRARPAVPAAWRRLPLLAGLAVFALGMLPSFTHAPLRFWGDALLHLPVMQRVLDGGLPPENPFLAGAPLGYFWFYHVALAPAARLSTLPLDWIPALMNGQALLLLLWAVNRAGRAFGLSPLARAAALVLLGTGLTPWGWMRFLVVQATHPEVNWPLVRAWGISGLLPILNPVDPRLAGALTKVAVSNALPLSLALAALAAAPPDPGPWAALRRSVLVAGCLAFHLAVGLLLAAGLGLRWVAAGRILQRRLPPAEARAAVPGSLSELLPLVLGLGIAAPYAWSVLRVREGAMVTPGWHGGHALGLHLALAGMWLLCLPVLYAWWRRDATRGWLVIGIPALVLPFVVHLVDGNEYKSIFFLLVLLSPAAGAGLERLARGRVWAAAVLVLFLPTSLLVARGLLREVPRGYLTPAERREVRALGAALPPDAVVWTPDPGPGYSPLTLPLGRPSYVSDTYALQIMGQWESEEARWRRGSLAAAGSPATLPDALGAARARVGGRPLAVAVNPATAARHPFLGKSLLRLGFRPLAKHPLLVLYTDVPDSAAARIPP